MTSPSNEPNRQEAALQFLEDLEARHDRVLDDLATLSQQVESVLAELQEPRAEETAES